MLPISLWMEEEKWIQGKTLERVEREWKGWRPWTVVHCSWWQLVVCFSEIIKYCVCGDCTSPSTNRSVNSHVSAWCVWGLGSSRISAPKISFSSLLSESSQSYPAEGRLWPGWLALRHVLLGTLVNSDGVNTTLWLWHLFACQCHRAVNSHR